MRRETGSTPGSYASYAVGALAFAGLLVWQAGDPKLGAYVVGGFAAAVLVFFVVAWAVLKLLTRPAVVAAWPALSLRSTTCAHARGNAVRCEPRLGSRGLLLRSRARSGRCWRRSAPADAPNRFLLGVQPDQLQEVQKFFAERKVAPPDLYPMVRGRLTAVNAKPVSEADFTEERAKRLVEREFNLSYLAELPAHNSLTAGRWLNRPEREISVAEARRAAGRKLGDADVHGGRGRVQRAHHLAAACAGLDEVNFFVIAPPAC